MFCEMRKVVFVLNPETMYTKCADSDQIARMLYHLIIIIFIILRFFHLEHDISNI